LAKIAATQSQQKISLGEMRSSGPRRLLVYCADYRCGPARVGFDTLMASWEQGQCRCIVCLCFSAGRDTTPPDSACPLALTSRWGHFFARRTNVKIDADRRPDHVRLSDLAPKFTCQACGHHGAGIRPLFQNTGF
jgi:hypothetical protein